MHSNEEAIDSPSPSFSSYYNTDLAQVVARVATEFLTFDDDDFHEIGGEQSGDLEDDGEFEFNSSVPADGELLHVYPVFNRDLLCDYADSISRSEIQLKNLFLEDRDHHSLCSSSSSEEDEVEEIPDGAYCVWIPNKSRLASPGRCTKSNSTGSSVKAWRLRDLLKRSKSDGKNRDGMILLTPKKKATAAGAGTAAAREGYLNGRSRAANMEKNKRRTYLPYRQDLLGFSLTRLGR